MSKDINTNPSVIDDFDMSMFNNDFMSSDNVVVKDNDKTDVNDQETKDDLDDKDDATYLDKDKKVKDERTKDKADDSTDDDKDADGTETDSDDDGDTDSDSDSDTDGDDNSQDNDGDDGSDADEDDFAEEEEILVNHIKDKLKDVVQFDEEDEPKTVEDLVEFFEENAIEMAKPEYPSDEMEDLHDFVSNGGDLREYFEAKFGEVDLDNIDLNKESSQKSVVSDYLKNKGYSDKRIERTLDRFEDAGILAEEAEDALEELKEIRESNAKQLLKQQEDAKEQSIKQQQKFLTDVKSSIDNIDNIMGVPISKKEKNELMEYAFKTDSNGQTQYQKEFGKDYVNSLIESAYIQKNKGTFTKKVEKNVGTNVKKDMFKKMRNTSSRRSKGSSSAADHRSGKVNLFDSVFKALG